MHRRELTRSEQRLRQRAILRTELQSAIAKRDDCIDSIRKLRELPG